MSSSNSLSNPSRPFVADTSVLINLNASGRAHDLIRAFPNRFVVTENAISELAAGIKNGHEDGRQVETLMSAGLIELAVLSEDAMATYSALIEGSAARTLDDGEAATIAFAYHSGGVALLDERKARSRCVTDYNGLPLASTVELFLHESVGGALGNQGMIDALLAALQKGRMRVPLELVGMVVGLIGEKHAVNCPSIPRNWRSSK